KVLQKWVSPHNVVDMKQFRETMTLGDALALCREQISNKKLEWIFVLDVAAFKNELPKAKRDVDIFDTKVRFDAEPRYLPASVFLRRTLNQIPDVEATYFIRSNHVEITTVAAAKYRSVLPTLAESGKRLGWEDDFWRRAEKPPRISTAE